MAWFILFMASLCEIAWAMGLKYSDGFKKLWPSVFTIVFVVASMLLLAKAVRTLPMGAAYAVWTGVGAAGTVIASVMLFKEPMSIYKGVCVGLIILGVVGLQLGGTEG